MPVTSRLEYLKIQDSGQTVNGTPHWTFNDSKANTKSYQDCNVFIPSQSTSNATLTPNPAYVMGVNVVGSMLGTFSLIGMTNSATSYGTYTINAGTLNLQVWPTGNARRFETNILYSMSTAADAGKVVLDWKPINP